MDAQVQEEMETLSGNLSTLSQMLAGDVLSNTDRPDPEVEGRFADRLRTWFNTKPQMFEAAAPLLSEFDNEAVGVFAIGDSDTELLKRAVADYNRLRVPVMEALDAIMLANNELGEIVANASREEDQIARLADDAADDIRDVVIAASQAWSYVEENGEMYVSIFQN